MRLGKEMSEIHEPEYANWQLGAMEIEKAIKFITPPGSNFSLNLHYSFKRGYVTLFSYIFKS